MDRLDGEGQQPVPQVHSESNLWNWVSQYPCSDISDIIGSCNMYAACVPNLKNVNSNHLRFCSPASEAVEVDVHLTWSYNFLLDEKSWHLKDIRKHWDIVQLGVNPKIVVSQNGWFIRGNPIKMDDLGVPPFLETLNCLYITILCFLCQDESKNLAQVEQWAHHFWHS